MSEKQPNFEQEKVLKLQFEWQQLLGRFNIEQNKSQELFQALTKFYSEPNRFYHNLSHIAESLEILKSIDRMSKEPDYIKLAIWLHDVIYNPKASDNEEKSAEFAKQILRQVGISDKIIDEVTRLILLTKTHKTTENDINGGVIIDVDLAILGDRPERYQQYSQQIRNEYSWLSNEQYYIGRIRVLENFLSRNRIFLTDELYKEREEQVRSNIKREIKILKQ